MIITKSLFVEFTNHPKLARRHTNNKEKHQEILASLYGTMDGIAIGQAVEDMVMQTYQKSSITEIDTKNMWQNRHETYHQRTAQTIQETDPTVLYQPGFFVDDLFTKCDFLVRNTQGTYDLVEVKAKNTIRRSTKAAPLLDDLVADISIQHYILTKALGDKFSGQCFLAHLNKTYVKNGSHKPSEIIIQENVTDELLSSSQVEEILETMRQSLPLPEDKFNKQYPYPGTDHMVYFGAPQPKQSLRSITRLNANKKLELYNQGKIALSSFTEDDILTLQNNKQQDTPASNFLRLWLSGEEMVNKPAIQEQLATLEYPLYFYDYETMSVPVPLLDGTSPWQQVVVQYSLHKITEDGTITHHEALLDPLQRHDAGSLFATQSQTNETVLKQMVSAMDGCTQGTFIVWYKGFENTRNTERAKQFPEYDQQLSYINAHTFDLMEIFSKQLYFHRDFEGSSSIKKVLPVLSDISYEGMAVPNGAAAANLLAKLIGGSLQGKDAVEAQKNLLAYCKQDTWAMVALWQKVKEKVDMK